MTSVFNEQVRLRMDSSQTRAYRGRNRGVLTNVARTPSACLPPYPAPAAPATVAACVVPFVSGLPAWSLLMGRSQGSPELRVLVQTQTLLGQV